MKLYYAPGACSLSVHIALIEAELSYSLEKVDLRSPERKTESGKDFRTINPAGYVPVLEMDDGRILSEGGSILEYIADIAPSARLAPEQATFERAQMRSWLYFLATEVLKSIGPLFNPAITPEERSSVTAKLQSRYAIVDKALSDGRSYLMGNSFSVADCYAYVVIGYAHLLKVDITNLTHLSAYLARIGERSAVIAAKKEEGLI